jgi:hypothetical protein
MPDLALILPHRGAGSWRADCERSESAMPWPQEVNRCPDCLTPDVLAPMLDSRAAAARAGIAFSTWTGHHAASRPFPDFTDGRGWPWWLVSSVDRWTITRRMWRRTARRIIDGNS